MELQAQSPKLLNILANLNKVGSRVNQISSGDKASVADVLDLIADSAIEVIPDTSAVIYTYDQEIKSFDPTSRVASGERNVPMVGDTPRPNGLGNLSIMEGRRILSYDPDSPPIHPINSEAGAKVVACFPLTVANEYVGALYIYNHKNRPFSEVELLLLENFVFQAAMAIYHARQMIRIQNDLVRREEETRQLHHAGLLISSHPNLNETLESILKMALEVTDAQFGNCMLISKNRQELQIAATAGECLSRPNTSNIRINSKSVTAWVARNRQPVLIHDLKEKPWSDNYVTFDIDLEMRSELAVPLIGASGRVEGVINLESPIPHAFNERDNYLLQGLATHAVITIQDMLLLDAIKSVTFQLLTKPCKEVMRGLADLCIGLLNVDASAIWVREGREMALWAANFEHQHGESIPLDNSLAGEAIRKHKPIISENVQTDKRFHRPDLAVEHGWEKALVVPLSIDPGQEPVGAISVYSKSEQSAGRFAESDWDMKVLTLLADYATLAIVESNRNEALELIKAKNTATETFAALGDISANLMHQLNNKVGIIPVRVQGIQEKCQPALEENKYLADNLMLIESDVRKAMQQVRENLSLLKPIEMVPVNLGECLQEAINSAALPDGIDLKVNGFSTLPVVEAGKYSMVFIFENLLENAVAALKNQGTITVAGSYNDQWVKIDVTDTGPGIEADHLGNIFEYNFSESSTFENKLGFGLWWIKTFLTRLGGSITAESDGKTGSVFRIRMPNNQARENQENSV